MILVAKDQNLFSKDQSLGFEDEETKINGIDAFGIINRSPYSNSVKKILIAIFDTFFNDELRRENVVSYLNASNSASTDCIGYLQELNVIEQVKGKEKGNTDSDKAKNEPYESTASGYAPEHRLPS